MQTPIRSALTWVILGVSLMMAGFTGLDLASGVQSTALWLGLIFWLLFVAITAWMLKQERRERSPESGRDAPHPRQKEY